MPVFSHASSRLSPSLARNAFDLLFARCRNCTYSQLVGWYISVIVPTVAPGGGFSVTSSQ